MQQLSGLDASFLYLETANAPMHIGGISIYDMATAPDEIVTYKGILENTEKRLHLARSFRQKIVRVPFDLDHPYWVEDGSFDIEFHVRHIALPKPGDWRQLCIQAARLHARELDLTKPLWEFYVIEGLDNVDGIPPGSFAVISKIHHAAIDGVSGAELTAAIHDLTPDAEPPPPTSEWKPEPEPNPFELLARAGLSNAVQPFRFAQVARQTIPALRRVAQGVRRRELALPNTRVPRTRFNGSVSPHRVVEGRSFGLEEMKRIKNAVPGATINDAVLAVVGGAMRKYLESKGELPGDSLVAMAPISVRSDDQKGTAGNQVSTMAVSLRTDVAAASDRLRAVHEGTSKSKALTNAIGARLLTDYTQFIPSAVAGLAARLSSRIGLANRTNPIFNTTVTNVPGPQIPLYSTGARLVTMYGMGPVQDGMGLIHPVFSYCGQITISVTACRDMMPDPGFYAECLQDSFDESLKAAS